MLDKTLARSSIPSRTRPARALEHSISLCSLLCSRTESNRHQPLRRGLSYPLNDESVSLWYLKIRTVERTASTLIDHYMVSTPCGFSVCIGMLHKMLARSSIPRRTSPRRAQGHSFSLCSSLCPREESNLDHELRKLASYPLNDGGNTFLTVSEPEPRRH